MYKMCQKEMKGNFQRKRRALTLIVGIGGVGGVGGVPKGKGNVNRK